MTVELFKIIGSKKTLRPDQVRLSILTALNAEEAALRKEFEKTVENWEHNRPYFDALRSTAGGRLVLIMGPSDREHGHVPDKEDPGRKKHPSGAEKWLWLDEGTDTRKFVMKQPFRRKTFPNTLATTSGEYSGAYMVKDDQPGIEPRNWSYHIGQKMERRFARAMEAALKRGIDKTFGGR